MTPDVHRMKEGTEQKTGFEASTIPNHWAETQAREHTILLLYITKHVINHPKIQKLNSTLSEFACDLSLENSKSRPESLFFNWDTMICRL